MPLWAWTIALKEAPTRLDRERLVIDLVGFGA